MSETKMLMVRIPVDMHEELVRVSRENERSVSQTIRFAIRAHLARHGSTTG